MQVHPVVGDIQRRRQQLRTHTLALPRDGDAHTETAGMATTTARILFQADVADHGPLMQGHDFHQPLVILSQAFTPEFGGLKRHLQGLTAYQRIVVKRGNTLDVRFAEAFEGDDGIGGGHE
ncbi:hypothetical protein D3C85_1428920 [compost metagenome]